MQSKVTLIGLYNYDNSLFDNLALPAGIDSDTVKDQILMRSGEFELLYPDFEFMKLSIAHFSKKHYRTFDKWIKALNIVYDPLNNYDRKEEYTDTHTENESSIANSESKTLGSTTPAATTNTNTKSVSAFDSTGYQAKEQTTDQLTVNTAGSDSSTINSNGTTSRGSEISIKHDAHLYGNIGVTTSQQMLESELDIARFNIAEQIADLFVEEYCLMIY